MTGAFYPQLRTIHDVIAHHGREHADHVAIICEDRRLTYGELHNLSNRTANAMHRSGVEAGDRVCFLGKESEHYYDILFACAKAGAVLTPVNWRLKPAEIHHILHDSGATLLFADDEFLDMAATLKEDLPRLRRIVPLPAIADWRGTDDTELHAVFGEEHPVAQVYTSGTTGNPKGAVLAHRSFFAIKHALANAGLDWIDWRPEDVSLIGIPGFHIGGLWWAVQGFGAGITMVSVPVFAGHKVVRLVRDLGITTACLVPAQMQMMLAPPRPRREDFSALRKIVYGGSPISESLLGRCIETFDCEFAQIYGLTECGNTAVCLPPAQHVPGGPRMQAAGMPYPGVEVKVLDDDGEPVGPGVVGEVCLRSPALMLEYWGLPEATASTVVDGWLVTGDAGYVDEEGFLFIRDRVKDTIIVAGENVYPAEIENAVAAHEAVLEAAAVGVPNEHWGEVVHCFVVPRQGETVTTRQLVAFLRNRIADFKIPSSFELIDTLPRNPSGKILRRELRERFWQHLDRRVA
ncbi:long-chain-fatty-acid--CoA ligase [Actinophytocola oryzae]|uniref:Long-chain acyl-CoA synthetase n=1 Tax=Actinophytocola oryzae TaxID=502181 RepID=A0A4R7V0F9_9PSEU|nr:long-chain-fatty-acid--CoA ligase [Actinophytocola oryzae]TDV42270.1 long-chain acyl-CoA synthetase [Actinophytocola oryzae]